MPGLWEAKHTTSLQCCPVGVVSAFHSSSWIFSFAPMGSGDVILCADHPILGQVVIVLHLDYPNCYESQDAFSSGHVECTSLPHRTDVFAFWPCLYKHWNSGPVHSNFAVLAPSFQTLEFSLYFYIHWNSSPILSNIGIPALSFQTLEFSPYFYKHWNSGPLHSNIGIPAPSFETLEFSPYFYKDWNSSPIYSNIGIPAPSSQTLKFSPCFCRRFNFVPILSNIGILSLFLWTY